MKMKAVKYGYWVLVMVFIATCGVNKASASGCEKKIDEINKQLSFAKSSGNTNEVSRLQMALERVKSNCTESSVARHDDKKTAKLKRKISEKKEDLIEHQQDLEKAKAQNKTGKIEKYSRKIQEDQETIHRLEKELSERQGAK